MHPIDRRFHERGRSLGAAGGIVAGGHRDLGERGLVKHGSIGLGQHDGQPERL
jgi:hypothetical protein